MFESFIKKAAKIIREEGPVSLVRKAYKKIVQSKEIEKIIAEAKSNMEIEISIIIPVYNAVAYTRECIEKVYTIGSDHTFEVIVVDNASSDNTPDEMKNETVRRAHFSYYRMKNNLGFVFWWQRQKQ